MITSAIDLRQARIASVFVFDLVGHSKRGFADVEKIQGIVRSTFRNGLDALRLEKSQIKNTGDGYICVFYDEDTARLMDFINLSIPNLEKELSEYEQKFRMGIDFGLLHPKEDELTSTLEHFDLPGIQAARLEAKAKPGQIICTLTTREIFQNKYPEMFSEDSTVIQTKDRELMAFEVRPFNFSAAQGSIQKYLSGSSSKVDVNELKAKRVLLVDDEPGILESFKIFIDGMKNEDETSVELVADIALSASEALELFEPGKYCVVFTDLMMPGLDGLGFTREILKKDPDLAVVMVTGAYAENAKAEFFKEGGSYFLPKPWKISKLGKIIRLAIASKSKDGFKRLSFVLERPGDFFVNLDSVSMLMTELLERLSSKDIVTTFLRHKAKALIADFVKRFKPGTDVNHEAFALSQQFKTYNKLIHIHEAGETEDVVSFVDEYLKDLKKRNTEIDFIFEASVEGWRKRNSPLVPLIVCELVDNALSAIRKSRLYLNTGKGEINIKIDYSRIQNSIYLIVGDTGAGIPGGQRDSVFQIGFSTNGPGRGLGLNVIYEAVQLTQGKIEYDYVDGKSKFSIEIPIADDK